MIIYWITNNNRSLLITTDIRKKVLVIVFTVDDLDFAPSIHKESVILLKRLRVDSFQIDITISLI